MKPALCAIRRARRSLQQDTPPGPTRTVTLSDEHYQDALRAILEALSEQLEMAARELSPVLVQPIRRPSAADAFTHLHSVCRTVEALGALGWPEDRDEILEKFAELHGTAHPAHRERRES